MGGGERTASEFPPRGPVASIVWPEHRQQVHNVPSYTGRLDQQGSPGRRESTFCREPGGAQTAGLLAPGRTPVPCVRPGRGVGGTWGEVRTLVDREAGSRTAASPEVPPHGFAQERVVSHVRSSGVPASGEGAHGSRGAAVVPEGGEASRGSAGGWMCTVGTLARVQAWGARGEAWPAGHLPCSQGAPGPAGCPCKRSQGHCHEPTEPRPCPARPWLRHAGKAVRAALPCVPLLSSSPAREPAEGRGCSVVPWPPTLSPVLLRVGRGAPPSLPQPPIQTPASSILGVLACPCSAPPNLLPPFRPPGLRP